VWRFTLKSLLGHKLRFALTALAVLLGVAFMAGTLVLTDTIKAIFHDLVASVNEGTDAYVRSTDVVQTAFGSQRNRIDASLLPTVRAVDGVDEAEGNLQFYAQIVAPDGRPIGDPGRGTPTFGLIWTPGPLNSFRIADGRAPRGPGEVVVDRASAQEGKLRIGQTVTVLSQQAPARFRLVGIATFGEADSPAGASTALFTPEAAQMLSGAVGQYDGISVAAAPGVSQREIVTRVRRAIASPDVQVITGARLTEENQAEFTKQLSFFNTALIAFALISLFVGSFIIFNTFSIIVAQRTREIGLMRAIGATGGQVVRSVLAEATVVGLVASVAGLGVGILLASGLKALLGALGIDLPAGATQILPRTVIVSLLLGTGITVLASILPARRAARVAPIQALRAGIAPVGRRLIVRSILGVVLTGLGVLALLAGLGGGGVELVGLGAVVIFLGVAVLGPVIARPVSRLIAWPLPRLRGTVGTLARENAARNPRRTASTAAALMIGVALVGFITIFASSTKESINASVDAAFRADFVIRSKSNGGPPGAGGGFSPALAAEVATLPGVGASSGLRFGGAEIAGKGVFLVASDPATSTELFDVNPKRGDFETLGPDDVAVSVDRMRSEGWRLGERIPARFQTGPATLRIAATYGSGQQSGLSDYFLSLAGYDAHFTDHLDAQVWVKAAPGADRAALHRDLERVIRDYPTAQVQDQAQFKASQGSQIDQILNLIYALLALAVVIALIGITNTLGLSILERTSELGLLRAVGMTRSQLRAVIRWEAVIIALLGTALGIVIAVFFGWALVTALKDEGFSTFVVPVGRLVTIVVLAAFAGVLAAVLPARRAAKIDVLDAISYE
jgi:putative ABC transport system permease protein